MTILFLSRRFCPYLGGVEKHVKAIADELIARGYNVCVVTQQFTEAESLREKCGNISVIRIPKQYNEKKLDTWKWIVKNKSIFTQADIVHVHDVSWWILPIFMNIRKKIFTTFHGWEGKYPVPLKNKVERLLYSLLSRKTIHIGSWIQEFYYDNPSLVLYGGVDKVEQVKNKIDNKSKHINLSFIGRLSKDNDIELYIKVLQQLQKKNIPFKITWIGDGEYRKRCEHFGQITGMVESYHMYLASADIVCASSYLSMLEAQAAGKPIIALYSHDLKKRYLETYPVHDACLVTNNLEAAVNYIQNSKTSKQHRHVQTAAQELSKYTWKNVTSQYIQLWNNNR